MYHRSCTVLPTCNLHSLFKTVNVSPCETNQTYLFCTPPHGHCILGQPPVFLRLQSGYLPNTKQFPKKSAKKKMQMYAHSCFHPLPPCEYEQWVHQDKQLLALTLEQVAWLYCKTLVTGLKDSACSVELKLLA